jgi:Tol biopolymer transport system component
MRQLAYVDEDGQIRIADLDSNSETQVAPASTGDPQSEHHVICNWPVWSPAGERLAFFQYELAGDEVRRTSVRLASPDGTDEGEAYSLPSGAPIYMCWSPDGNRLAVLVQEERELYLRVVQREDHRPAVTVAQGAPVYFAWHPDSRGLVIHTGGAGLAPPRARVIWVRLEGGQATYATLAGTPAADFRAPAWSNQHGAATLAFTRDDEGSEIVLQDGPDAESETLATTGSGPAFIWSRDGARLAFASRAPEFGGAYGPISIWRGDTRSSTEVTEGPCLAFFWCPDGRRLVYTGGEMGGRLMNVQCMDTASGEHKSLGWVRPGRDFMLLLGHFDQYSQSAQLFSPDGNEMVLSASLAQEQVNGSVPTVRQILVRALSGEGVQEVAARGRLAFWRPGA